MNIISRLFSADGFMPHGHCYLWNPSLVWLHVISDSLITLAYLSIPLTLIYIARKRRDLPFDWMFACFAIFILACGTTHAMEVWTLWHPTYWLSGAIKAIAAVASIATALLLIRLIRPLLAIPSPATLRNANAALEKEVAERCRTEEELRASKRFAESITKNSASLIYIFDLETRRICYVNRNLEEFLGFSEAQIIELGDDFFPSIIHAEDLPRVAEHFSDCVNVPADGVFDHEFRVKHASGDWRWLGTRESVFHRHPDGTAWQVLGTGLDITERKRAQKEVQRVAGIVASSHDAILSTTLDGTILSWNPAAETLFGYSAEEAIGQSVAMLLPPGRIEEEGNLIERVQSQEFVDQYESLQMRKDGSLVGVSLTISPVKDSAGQVIGSSIIARDITERQRANAELRAATVAAQAASRAKSEFLANMSHEIRTPMNGVLGMTELVLETKLDREQREYLGMAKSSANALLNLINDILDFSKIEAGKLELESVSFSLRDCLGAMLKPLGLRADQKGIELTAEISPDAPDHLVGDSMRLRQILSNLIDNAIKFTERGDVTMRVAVESKAREEAVLEFSVSDTGIGIPEEKQALIFGAFEQVDGTTTRNYGGTGLGLTIASHLVREMGGRIWVSSTVGEGTTFHFTAKLPMRNTPAPNVHRKDPSKLRTLRVLVVDDNALNRHVLCQTLAQWGMQPAAVASGVEAIAELRRAVRNGSPFSLILLDAMMPEMDGFMVAEKIHENNELSIATVMMLSSAMPLGAPARCAELGVASYLMKPVTPFDLLDAILVAMGGAAEPDRRAKAAPILRATSRLRILVTEDNLVNRAVAAAILEKRGHSLVHAGNGREAVEAAAREPFDLILMDIQMPELDGFEATRRIRESELATGDHIPIVAMTAYAMVGDRERCLAAGMDGYISKPLKKAELLSLLERTTNGRNLAPSAGGPGKAGAEASARPADPKRLPIFSREKLLSQVDGDEALLEQLTAIFHETTPRLLDDLRSAVARGSANELARAAHALLSSLGAFGAGEALRLTRDLEEMGNKNDLGEARNVFEALELEVAAVTSALDNIRGPVPAEAAKPSPISSREKLLDEFGGDEELLEQLTAIFHENTPRLLDNIRDAIARRSAKEVAHSAHALLSSLGAFGAEKALRLGRELEEMGNSNSLDRAQSTFDALEREVETAYAALNSWACARPVNGEAECKPAS